MCILIQDANEYLCRIHKLSWLRQECLRVFFNTFFILWSSKCKSEKVRWDNFFPLRRDNFEIDVFFKSNEKKMSKIQM